MSTKKPDAIRIAEWLEGIRGNTWPSYIPQDAAAELRRLHAENESLHLSHEVACSVIEGLQKRVQELGEMARENRSKKVIELEGRIAEMKEQMAAIGAGGVEPLRKRCLRKISEPQAQPVAWAIFAEGGGACMWTQIRQHAEATAKDVGLQVTPLYAAPQPAAPRNATLYDPHDVAFPAPRSADEGDALPTELASIAKQASTAAAEVAAPSEPVHEPLTDEQIDEIHLANSDAYEPRHHCCAEGRPAC